MWLVFRGPSGTVRTDWSEYALLRDNVQHYVEGGAPTERYGALHSIERAVERGHQRVDASRLRCEVLGTRFALNKLSLGASAVSIRTRAVQIGCSKWPSVRGTALASRAGWSPAIQGSPDERVVSVLSGFFRAILTLTDASVDGDRVLVEVECSESKPS